MENKETEPSRDQKTVLAAHKLNMRNWSIVSETSTYLIVQYKYGSQIKELDKRVDLWGNKKAPVI